MDAVQSPRSYRVLVVDDEPSIRFVVASALERLGHVPTVADSGAEGLRLVQDDAKAFDVIITDVVMPEMGGKELAQRVSNLAPHLKVIFMSGYPEAVVVRRHGIEPPADLYVRKPLSLQALQEAIDRLCGS